jgi:hypothetical protein
METAFDANFSGVKVHTDGESDQLNKSLNSRALLQDKIFSLVRELIIPEVEMDRNY